MSRRSQWSLLLAVVVLLTGSCAQAPARSAGTGSAPTSAAHNDTTTPFNLVSLPALIAHEYDAGPLRVDHLVADEVASRRYHVTYRSGSLDVSGQLSLPKRQGRFPLVVIAHGYEPPAGYRSGVALAREQSHLAARGYAVLLTDYRNHADSDRERGAAPVAAPLGYPEDVVNAVLAVRRAGLDSVDTSRVAVLGRSMGGGVALAAVAARPDLVDALVLSSPVSSSAVDNLERWVVPGGRLDDRVRAAYGTPQSNPAFWREASVRGYLDRVDVPVQVHHGTADTVTPVEWSRTTVDALRAAGQSVELFEYPGEGHRVDEAWGTMARRITGFLDEHV